MEIIEIMGTKISELCTEYGIKYCSGINLPIISAVVIVVAVVLIVIVIAQLISSLLRTSEQPSIESTSAHFGDVNKVTKDDATQEIEKIEEVEEVEGVIFTEVTLQFGSASPFITIRDVVELDDFNDDTIQVRTRTASHLFALSPHDMLICIGTKSDDVWDDVCTFRVYSDGLQIYEIDLAQVEWDDFDGTAIEGYRKDNSPIKIYLGNGLTKHLIQK